MKMIALAFIAVFATGVAQENIPLVELHVSATVVDQIEVITLADIDAGTILSGDAEKVISPILDGGAGILRLEGQRNSSIQISYSKQVTMTNLLTSDPLMMNYMLSGGVDDNQTVSEIFTSNPANVTLNAEGVYFIWVGCRFSTSGLVPGQYDGDFLIEVDYN